MADRCVVLFPGGAPKDWQCAARIVAAASATLGKGDATRLCRFGHGLLFVALDGSEARAIAAALQSGGFEAEALPAAELNLPPAPFTLNNADALPDGFHVPIDASGRMSILPWNTLRLLHAGYVRPGSASPKLPDAVEQRERAEALAAIETGPEPILSSGAAGSLGVVADALVLGALTGTSLPAAFVLRKAMADHAAAANSLGGAALPPNAPECWLEVFTLEPLLRLRIRRHTFNYDYLGGRRAASGRKNFQILAADLVAFAPQAAKTGLLPAVLKGQEPENQRWLVDEKDHEIALAALLTREKRYGLPR